MLNTLVHDKPVSMGSQWAMFVPSVFIDRLQPLQFVYGHNRTPQSQTVLYFCLDFTWDQSSFGTGVWSICKNA